MKKLFLSAACLCAGCAMIAQKYPEPEFANEIYFFKKDSATLMRLEKGSSKMDTRVKMAGLGGAESGYEIEGEKSPVRLSNGRGLSFILFKGSTGSSNFMDSMMRANGMDPSAMKEMSDPANMISLYRVAPVKDKRKVYLQKSGGMFSANKNQSSDKYTFSVKKVREGYWELLVDKTLSRGEYAFTMMNMGMGNMDGSMLLFAFAVD